MTANRQRIFLFDVDGVIVKPVAYRIGINRTLTELAAKIDLQECNAILPTEEEISAMEANGVHDVWDITNIYFCDILTTIALQTKPIELLSTTPHSATTKLLHAIEALAPSVPRPNYLSLAEAMAPRRQHILAVHNADEPTHPPDIALKLFSTKLANHGQRDLWIDLLRHFLVGTRSAYSSYGTRLFQDIILGSSDFESTYRLESEVQGPGLLRTEDETLISQRTVDELIALNQQPLCFVGVYTARPSLPPKAAKISPVGYSPEAEIALESAGMQSFPLIGMGMMEWLGKEHKERTEDLTKPNLTQALAALINTIAAGKDDVDALLDAYAVDKVAKNPDSTPLIAIKDKQTDVYVFEDTVSGIVPLLKTAELLRTAGYQLQVHPLGIATDANKKAALQKYCEQVFANVNEAFEHTTCHTAS